MSSWSGAQLNTGMEKRRDNRKEQKRTNKREKREVNI
jgi:hypothetical protein